jgi:hypothetical protein
MPPAIGTARAIEKPHAVSEKEYIDISRACRILGVSWRPLREMAEAGCINLMEYRQGIRLKKVRYQSVVDYCDRLRAEFLIPDQRPPLSSTLFRHRDEDLLPFRLRDTISMEEALSALGYNSGTSVGKLIDLGCFWAYKLRARAPWRISAPSLSEYLDQVLKGIARPKVEPSSRF